MKSKVTISDILEVINIRANEAINRLYEQRVQWLKDFDLVDCECSGHDSATAFDGIVDCNDEWNCFMEAASNYIKNKEYGFTLLIKDLRKNGYEVSRSGNVFPKTAISQNIRKVVRQ